MNASRWKTILVNVVVTVLTALVILTAREAFFTWQRVNSMWLWVQQQAQMQADYAKQQLPQPNLPPTGSPKK